MTLPSSGTITHAMIQAEFGGSNPIGLNEYYGVATGVPTSGTITNADFYGTSAAPTVFTLNGGTYSSNGVTYIGYGRANKFAFLHPESGTNFSVNVGSVSQYVGVVGSYDLLGLMATSNSSGSYIIITVSNPYGSNPNWTRMGIGNSGASTNTFSVLNRSDFDYYGANQHGIGFIAFRSNEDSASTVLGHLTNSVSSAKDVYFE